MRRGARPFDAQHATGTLLLLSGSLALGLAAFWVTPDRAAGTGTSAADTVARGVAGDDPYASDEGSYAEDGAYAAPAQPGRGWSYGFSNRAAQVPSATTRGS